MQEKRVVITGLGVVSSFSDRATEHAVLLNDLAPYGLARVYDLPISVHKPVEVDWQKHIAKKNDLRQMSLWQKMGVYAAAEALEDAGIIANKDLLTKLDVLVATSGGDRDIDADNAVLSSLHTLNSYDEKRHRLNGLLVKNLRPTLFLSQLANLLAGSIAIINKTQGRSLTFLGEESSAIKAFMQAKLMIKNSLSDIVLVGASFDGTSIDNIVNFYLGNFLALDNAEQKERSSKLKLGSAAVFFVLESEQHAITRKTKIYAALDRISLELLDREDKQYAQNLIDFYKKEHIFNSDLIVTSGQFPKKITEFFTTISLCKNLYNNLGYLKEAEFCMSLAFAVSVMIKSPHDYKTSSIALTGLQHGEATAEVKKYEAS